MSGDETTPSHRVLARASDANRRAGHENLGFLSVAHGLMPTAEPALHLAGTHRAWDDLAGELPELYSRLAVRRAIDALPMLPADGAALADEHLLRAGALLGILAHAYWWADREPPSALPEAVATPWRTVSHRLGRPAPHLSYVDLVVYNWRLVDPTRARQVQNMRLLLPTVGNEAEHVFYLTQAEILARCAPVVDAVVRAQGAVRADEADVLIEALETIEACLDEVIRHALPKINPARWSPTHVDPVLWAKTVAPFGVPFYPSAAGPSGTSSPIFHVLDAFFGRATYRTRLGQEMTHLNKWHPRHWRDFVDAIRQTSVRSYAEGRGHPPLRVAYDDTLARYAGESGFLGRHRTKVYGYLELAFKVGRTVTIGGFSGPFRARTWMDVDTELAHAANERRARPAADPSTDSAAGARAASTLDVPQLPRSAVALHNNERVGYWIAVDGVVYDVTRLRRIHPGGIDILDAHAGTDATAAFHRVGHHGSHRVHPLAGRHRIGTLDPEPHLTASDREVYRSWIDATYLVVEMENALRIDHALRSREHSVTPLSLRHRSEIHERFLSNYLDAVTDETTDRLWRQTLAGCQSTEDPEWMRKQMGRIRHSHDYLAVVEAADVLAADVRALGVATGPAGKLIAQQLEARCRLLERVDAALLADVKQLLRAGAQLVERDGVCSNGLLATLRRLPPVVARYCRHTAAVLRTAKTAG